MIYTGSIVRSAQALEIGLIDAIRPAQVSADEVVATVRRGERPRLARQTRLEVLQRFFDGHSVAQLLEPGLDQPSEPELIRAMIQLRNNGPIALRLAERLIDEGLAMTLEEGIRQELSGLRQVFATEDALSGLLTFGKSRATFVDR
jgi:enoyl-CoA hydratase/3-hydroxyacyl-CoA dehydrogenase